MRQTIGCWLCAGLISAWAIPLSAQEPKVLFKVEGTLSTSSDKEPGFYPFYYKDQLFQLKAGRAYRIDLVSKDFTTSLTVQDLDKQSEAVNGINPNTKDRKFSRLIYTPKKDGDHKVTVKGGGKEVGGYTLTICDVTDNENEIVDFQLNQIYRLNETERKRLLANLQKRFASSGANLTDKDAVTAEFVAKNLEYSKEEREAYLGFAKIFAESKSPIGDYTAKKLEERWQGRDRFLNLPGKTLDFRGTTTDGKPWDLKDQRGKVVLLYFWYAGSGVQDKVKKQFEAYQGRLVVVGLNVDKTKKALDISMKRAKDPWPTLNSLDRNEGPTKLFGDLAVSLGGSMPYILIDTEGKVVSTNAAGVEMTKLFEKLLGPPPPKKN
jgi:hypothetical protein